MLHLLSEGIWGRGTKYVLCTIVTVRQWHCNDPALCREMGHETRAVRHECLGWWIIGDDVPHDVTGSRTMMMLTEPITDIRIIISRFSNLQPCVDCYGMSPCLLYEQCDEFWAMFMLFECLTHHTSPHLPSALIKHEEKLMTSSWSLPKTEPKVNESWDYCLGDSNWARGVTKERWCRIKNGSFTHYRSIWPNIAHYINGL